MTGQSRWRRWVFRRKEITTTTWKFRAVALLALLTFLYAARTPLLLAVGNSLVHDESLQPAEILLLENFDPGYLVFEAAAELQRSGYAPRALIPVPSADEPDSLKLVEKEFVEVMGRIARLDGYEMLPVHHTEPISLNVANQVAEYLEANRIRSVIVVSPQFRSARSYLVYGHVFTPLGIHVQCYAAESERSPDNWWRTWHGVQDAGLEFAKLLYYRFWVL